MTDNDLTPKETSNSTGSADDIDRLLKGAFEQAMTSLDQRELSDRIIGRIKRRQRIQSIVLAVAALAAVAATIIGGLPLLELLGPTLRQAARFDWNDGIPWLAAGLLALLGVGWLHLLVDDPI